MRLTTGSARPARCAWPAQISLYASPVELSPVLLCRILGTAFALEQCVLMTACLHLTTACVNFEAPLEAVVRAFSQSSYFDVTFCSKDS